MNLNIEYHHPNDLNIDYTYQRKQDEKRVQRIADSFNIAQFDPLKVSRRADKSLWVWDGGHRLQAVRRLGEKTIPCLVYSLSAVQEAVSFAEAQSNHKGLSSFDAFRALLAAGDLEAHAIVKTLDHFDLRIQPGGGANRVQCVSKLRHLYRNGMLSRTAQLLTSIHWNEKKDGMHANIWGGVARFMSLAGVNLDTKRLENKLVSQHPGSLLASHGIYRYDVGVSLNIADLYNSGLSPKKKIDAS